MNIHSVLGSDTIQLRFFGCRKYDPIKYFTGFEFGSILFFLDWFRFGCLFQIFSNAYPETWEFRYTKVNTKKAKSFVIVNSRSKQRSLNFMWKAKTKRKKQSNNKIIIEEERVRGRRVDKETSVPAKTGCNLLFLLHWPHHSHASMFSFFSSQHFCTFLQIFFFLYCQNKP